MHKIFTRSVALALLSATAVTAPAFAATQQARASQPLLATPDQVEAERILRELLRDPELPAVQQRVKTYLASTAIGQTADGKARIDYAVTLWTNSFLFKEIIENRDVPLIIWGTDDTPRTWLGYSLAGVGTSGDNPDHIYRSTTLDGSGRYEITGKFDTQHRAAQFVFSVAAAHDPRQGLSKNGADLANGRSLVTDRDLKTAPDGSFRITLGGDDPAKNGNGDGSTHFPLPAGKVSVGFRDVLSDWDQRPAQLTIRRIDGAATRPVDRAALRQRVLEGFEPYVRFWSSFPEQWFGGLQPNAVSGPVPRDGGWGYLAGGRFSLKPDEALLVTTSHEGAGYAGIQVVDPWMIAPDGTRHLTSYNPDQAKANPDGTFSFVVSPRDPGVANWLDSGGVHDGFVLLRWQGFAANATGEGLLRDFRVIKLADAAKLPGATPVKPAERRAEVAQRAVEYAKRTR